MNALQLILLNALILGGATLITYLITHDTTKKHKKPLKR